jgi:transcriptional regulator with XRE-family HTH domain
VSEKEFVCFAHTECLGLVLRWARQNMELSQLEFARESGIDLMTISRTEHGIVAPDLTLIRMFAYHLKTTDVRLLEGAEKVSAAIHEVNPQAIHYPERHEKGYFPGALYWEHYLLEAVREKGLKP